MAEEKQHKPTQKKIDKVRKEGQTIKAPSLARVMAIAMILPIVIGGLPYYWVESRILLEYCFNGGQTSVGSCMHEGSRLGLTALLFVLSAASLGGIAVEVCQVGWKPQASLLRPKIERLNPISGAKKLFQGFRDVALRIPFVVALVTVAVFFLTQEVENTILYTVSGQTNVAEGVLGGVKVVVLILALYAATEYFLKRRRFFIDQSMSTQDLRDEYKDSEGDPQLKSMRQAMHEELAMQEIVKRVKSAKVIVIERM